MRGFATNRRFIAPMIFALLCLSLGIEARAQYPSPLANPDLQLPTNGVVNAIVSLPDGSVIFGGNFASVDGVSRSNLAKRRPDGTLDPAWDPAPDGPIYALAADSDGNIFVGGVIVNIGGQQRFGLAKLSATGIGAADANWNPSPTYEVYALAVDSGNNVYVGGYFITIGGQSRQNIAKVSGAGSGVVDATWNPGANSVGTVNTIAIDSANNIFVGGAFLSIGGQTHNYVAKLASMGTGAADATWNPNPDGYVSALAIDAIGSVYVGGSFATVGGKTRGRLAKLSGIDAGAADPDWNPSADNNVLALAIGATGDLYAGGSFQNIGGKARSRIARLSTAGSGAAHPTWNPTASYDVNALAVGASSVYAGGNFSRAGGQVRLGFAALSSSGVGTATVATDAELPGFVSALAVQPHGGIIVAGNFFKANGVSRTHILRLGSDGALDQLWNPSANDAVYAVASDAEGNVYAGGMFDSIGGQPRAHLAKLSGGGTGAVDVSWNAAADGPASALTTSADGDIYVGGSFSHVGGQPRAYIAKLSGATGVAVESWNPSADNYVSALETNADGDLYAGGSFRNIGGQLRLGIAKLKGTGSGEADAVWNASLDNPSVSAIAVDASGDVCVGGYFNSIGGQTRYGLGKVFGAGSGMPDLTWAPTTPLNGVFALAVDGDGNVYAGGSRLLSRYSGSSPATLDSTWKPSPGADVVALAINGSRVYVGGDSIYGGPQKSLSIAAFAVDGMFANGFEN